MANYDWFDKTPEDYRREAEHSARLASRGYEEKNLKFNDVKVLVCVLCGSVVYGTLDEKYATIHRTVCKKVTPGKHRAH